MKTERTRLSVCSAWEQIRLRFPFAPRTRLLCLTCAKRSWEQRDYSCGDWQLMSPRQPAPPPGEVWPYRVSTPTPSIIPCFCPHFLVTYPRLVVTPHNNAHTHTHTHTSVTKHRKITSSTSSQVATDGTKPAGNFRFKQGFTSTHI